MMPSAQPPLTGTHRVVFDAGTARSPAEHAGGVTIVVTVYNYEKFVIETLDSTVTQTFDPLSIVIVEDKGRDRSLELCEAWLAANAMRFKSAWLVQHETNCGLSAARNTAISLATTPYVFVLDADNLLYPRCIERCHAFIEASGSAFAYPVIERFGAEAGLMGVATWDDELLSFGNYIDAMALIRKSAWQMVGGYSLMRTTGWEDYDLWCKLASHGQHGVRVPMILARYRVHAASLLRTLSKQKIEDLVREISELHPWLKLG